ncbi:MAG: DUF4426 domain-containing protein [Thermomonas haemolytica]
MPLPPRPLFPASSALASGPAGALPLLAALLLAGCGGTSVPQPAGAQLAASASHATATATAGDAVLQATALDIAQLDPAMAARYGLDARQQGALLLVTLRDTNGDALAPDDLVLTATASVLPDPPRGLALQPIRVDGLTDYIGVFAARPPANVRFHLTATRHGARAEFDASTDLYPR